MEASPHVIPGLEALADTLRATDAQRALLRETLYRLKQQITDLFQTPPAQGGDSPLTVAARGYSPMQPGEPERPALHRYLYVFEPVPGKNYTDCISAVRDAALEELCAGLSPAQADELRIIVGTRLSDVATECDPLGDAIREALTPSEFRTWDDLRAALAFAPAEEDLLLRELRYLKEHLTAVLCAVPTGGLESPLDYEARLAAAGDPFQHDATAAYRERHIDPRFGDAYATVLYRVELNRRHWIGLRLGQAGNARLQRVLKQSLLTLDLPNDCYPARLRERSTALARQFPPANDTGETRLTWGAFCAALLFTSSQEKAILPLVTKLHAVACTEEASTSEALLLEAESEARRGLEATLGPKQRPRWNALTRRSLLTIDLPPGI